MAKIHLIPALSILVGFAAIWLFYRRFLMRRSLSIVPGPPPASVLKGNLPQLFGNSANSILFHEELPVKYGSVTKVYGLLWDKHLYVTDPLALHHIIVKDLYVFEESDDVTKSRKLIVGEGILSTHGAAHARQRKFLNPVFSIAHMRNLLPIFQRVVTELQSVVAIKVKSGTMEVDMHDATSRAALEFIGQAGLGYSFDAFNDNITNDYRDSIKYLAPALNRLSISRFLLPYVVDIGPAWLRRKVVEWTPNRDVQTAKNIVDIMDRTSRTIWKQKKEAHLSGTSDELVGGGKDVMSLMLKASESSGDSHIEEEELIAQMSTLIIAGHETTSSAISRTLHLLSLHQDEQDRLRKEVRAALEDTPELSYDKLMALPYLDAVCRETLRRYAPSNVQFRVCRKDTVVPLAIPVQATDGSWMSELMIPKGTNIHIGIGSANKLEAMWGPDAMEWKPDRWLTTGSITKLDAKFPGVYSSMMTFLGGGRACIGFKFSLMELKLVLSTLVASFKFSPANKESDVIEWRSTGLAKPYDQRGECDVPSLPLMVQAV